jgi:lipoic acid synthetase
MRKAAWLNKKVRLSFCRGLKTILRDLKLYTVCEESRCPNISECFSKGVATFMILGDTCTRKCSFCGIKKGIPQSPDFGESFRLIEAVEKLNLKYVVITSPTRDDLKDGGAEVFSGVIYNLRKRFSSLKIEVLIPDFAGKKEAIEKVAKASPDVVAHNLETVPRLYPTVRDGADYRRSLEVLKQVKQINNKIYTKSGIMLGLGEEEEEIIKVFKDLIDVKCDFLTIGQYLSPSLAHYPVKKYVHPSKFNYLKEKAYRIGFKRVESSPYIRSSYLTKI